MTLEQDIERFERWLADFDAKIADLQQQVERAQGYRRQGLQGELDKLKTRRHRAEEHLAEMKLMDAESWARKDLRSGIFAVFDDIGQRLDHLMARASE